MVTFFILDQLLKNESNEYKLMDSVPLVKDEELLRYIIKSKRAPYGMKMAAVNALDPSKDENKKAFVRFLDDFLNDWRAYRYENENNDAAVEYRGKMSFSGYWDLMTFTAPLVKSQELWRYAAIHANAGKLARSYIIPQKDEEQQAHLMPLEEAHDESEIKKRIEVSTDPKALAKLILAQPKFGNLAFNRLKTLPNLDDEALAIVDSPENPDAVIRQEAQNLRMKLIESHKDAPPTGTPGDRGAIGN